MDEWNGWPSSNGWHWLRRKRDGAMRLGLWSRYQWRVADEIGRTTIRSSTVVARWYDYRQAVQEPDDIQGERGA